MHRYKTGKEGEWKGGFESEEDDIRREGRKGESEGGMEEGKDRGREGGRDERRKRGREGRESLKGKGEREVGRLYIKNGGRMKAAQMYSAYTDHYKHTLLV